MSFAPYSPYSTNLAQPQRVALILLGLTATSVAFGELAVALLTRSRNPKTPVPFAAVFLACAVIGWRSYPYWVTGVYQVGIGAFPPMDQDPKGLMPMIWMGEFWRLPVLVLYPLCYVAIPTLAVLSLIAIWRRQFVAGIVTVTCTSVALIFMVGFSPDYVTWLMD